MRLRANTLVAASVLLSGGSALSASEPSLEFALNVSRHMLLHELGHAMIREFGLPVLGNEEDMADTFATVLITQAMRDDAVAILKDRARSWLYEGAQIKPEDYDLEGEHELDTRRAFRTICLLYGADPAEFSEVVEWIGLSEHDANECSDIAPDVIEGWERVLAPHRLADGELSDSIAVQYGEASHTMAVRQYRRYRNLRSGNSVASVAARPCRGMPRQGRAATDATEFPDLRLRYLSAVLVEIDDKWAADMKAYIKWECQDA